MRRAARRALSTSRALQAQASTSAAGYGSPAASSSASRVREPSLQSLSTQHQVNALLASHSAYVLNTYARPAFVVSHGKGMYLYDTQSRPYLDFTAGIAVNALGHADEGVAQVLQEQSTALVHCSNLINHFWSGETARLLVEETKKDGGLGFDAASTAAAHEQDVTEQAQDGVSSGLKVFFANSGTEVNEGALKFARKYGKVSDPSGNKTEIVSFNEAFHGRSMGALSVTHQKKYQQPFEPLIPGCLEAEYNNIEKINDFVTEKTCGVIVETIQGEGGLMEAQEEWLRALRKRCDEVDVVLIFDEIQCGLQRTGKLWAHGHFPKDCHPDVITMAKPLANGIPIGAIMMKDKIADVIKIGDHGTTFGGAPLPTRVAHHVVSRLTEPSFQLHVQTVGAYLRKRLVKLAETYPSLIGGPIRGRGLMLGMPLANAQLPGKMAEMCRDQGVLFLTCGRNTMRFVPSLIVTEADVDKAMDVLEKVMKELASST